jgi:hypothetical protein
MSADLLKELAALGISTREAAKRIDMSFWSFRVLRSEHPDIAWPMSHAKRATLKRGGINNSY